MVEAESFEISNLLSGETVPIPTLPKESSTKKSEVPTTKSSSA